MVKEPRICAPGAGQAAAHPPTPPSSEPGQGHAIDAIELARIALVAFSAQRHSEAAA